MKITIRYLKGQQLFYMRDNRIQKFVVANFKVMCVYAGDAGEWGSRAWPIDVYYSEFVSKEMWISEQLLFPSKEDLLKSL